MPYKSNATAMRHRRQASLCLVAGLVCHAALIGAGCSDHGPRRFPIEGRVTYDGVPVPAGSIRFEPDAAGGNHGPVGYAAILSGSYSTSHLGKGVLKGPLVAYVTGGPARDPQAEFPKLWFVEYRKTLTLEPKPGATMFDIDVPKDVPKSR